MPLSRYHLPDLLQKLNIDRLTSMQEEAVETILEQPEVMLTAPTGSGKTLAFLLPLLELVEPNIEGVQALILCPSRELASQTEQVMLALGSGLKVNAVYGGRSMHLDKQDLSHPPAILIGTPGRVADHLRKGRIDTRNIRTLVLDEYDKSLQTGFEQDMQEIVHALRGLERKVLTSATKSDELPAFLRIKDVRHLAFEGENHPDRRMIRVNAPGERSEQLLDLLRHLGPAPGIVFCNFRDSVEELSELLQEANVPHACFYGTMEQIDREHALLKFRNGSHTLLLATDLAARGIDVPEIRFIVHYEMPQKEEEFVHRNGRTARMQRDGEVYILAGNKGRASEYLKAMDFEDLRDLSPRALPKPSLRTLQLSGGKRHKISKGDLAGFVIKEGKLPADKLGKIELTRDYSYLAVPAAQAETLVDRLDNRKLKGHKLRIRII